MERPGEFWKIADCDVRTMSAERQGLYARVERLSAVLRRCQDVGRQGAFLSPTLLTDIRTVLGDKPS